jgi:Zinc-binding loop region of homing endonuclease
MEYLVLRPCRAPEVAAMLFVGHEASYLCHKPACINPAQLAVEDKAVNESRKHRKQCKHKLSPNDLRELQLLMWICRDSYDDPRLHISAPTRP